MIGWVFPKRDTTGTHVNVAAADRGEFAQSRERGEVFEYLTTDAAQAYFANQNYMSFRWCWGSVNVHRRPRSARSSVTTQSQPARREPT